MIALSLHPNEIHCNQLTRVALRLTNTSVGTYTNVRLTFRLPREILILRGKSQLPRISSLEKGAYHEYELYIKAACPGIFHLSSTNFSYLNSIGQAIRPSQILIPIQVIPTKNIPPAPKPINQGVQSPSMSSAEQKRHQFVTLRQILIKHFSEGELRTLCFDVGIDYDDLPGDGKANKARELVAHFERRNKIAELIFIIAQHRPSINLEDILKR